MDCREAPAARALYDQTRARYGGRVHFLGIIGDQAHQTQHSSHNCAPMQESGQYNPNYAHAVDIGVDSRTTGDSIWRAIKHDRRIRYAIFARRLLYPDWRGGGTAWASDHDGHIHISLVPGSTFDTSPYYRATPKPTPIPDFTALLGDDMLLHGTSSNGKPVNLLLLPGGGSVELSDKAASLHVGPQLGKPKDRIGRGTTNALVNMAKKD